MRGGTGHSPEWSSKCQLHQPKTMLAGADLGLRGGGGGGGGGGGDWVGQTSYFSSLFQN